jgi:hypothetical protein
MRLFTLIALVLNLFLANKVLAQSYYVRISGDVSTRVADLAFAERNSTLYKDKIAAYNVVQSNGDEDMGLVCLDAGQASLWSYQFHDLNGHILKVKRVFPTDNTSGIYILAERKDPVTSLITPIILELDVSGLLINTYLLPALPFSMQYVEVFDFYFDYTGTIRILCSAIHTASGNKYIVEAICNPGALSTYFTIYNLQDNFTVINGLFYIKRYHHGAEMMGSLSFYGMGTRLGRMVGFAFYRAVGSSTHQFQIYYFSGSRQISGIVANGADANIFGDDVITFAISGESPEFCLLQKTGLSGTNWQRHYKPDLGDGIMVSTGRGTHGIKGTSGPNGDLDYFIGNVVSNQNYTGPIVLMFNHNNGDLYTSSEYLFSNQQPTLGYPNFAEYNDSYFFISDRYLPVNGFKLSQGPFNIDPLQCTMHRAFTEVPDLIIEETPTINYDHTPLYSMAPIDLAQLVVPVDILPECDMEHRVNYYVQALPKKPLHLKAQGAVK